MATTNDIELMSIEIQKLPSIFLSQISYVYGVIWLEVNDPILPKIPRTAVAMCKSSC